MYESDDLVDGTEEAATCGHGASANECVTCLNELLANAKAELAS